MVENGLGQGIRLGIACYYAPNRLHWGRIMLVKAQNARGEVNETRHNQNVGRKTILGASQKQSSPIDVVVKLSDAQKDIDHLLSI